jgi:DNA-cytosine methyltransferase
MNVLSLFDGISCGQLALERAGIRYDNYYASEIDKYAIAVTQYRYPKTIQLGDVCNVNVDDLPSIDLLIGGSPCQGFSVAGKRLAFDDPRSKLFFEFVRIMKECKPRYFLLENVRMKKEHLDIITNYMGVEPIKINSALVSAQNRVRYYWTNIPNITQPEDREIYLKDILENGDCDRLKSYCINANYHKGTSLKTYQTKCKRQLVFQPTIAAIRGRYTETGSIEQRLEYRQDGKTNTITTVQKDNVLLQVGKANIKGHDSNKRVYSPNGKAPTVTTMGGGHREPKVALDHLRWRKLTPVECERLQTIPDNYTFVPWQNRMMSNTQRYKMIGNAWTVDVIKHILEAMQ